jgi:mRNA-degrading endonuclease HigB of HigAB toxin-antitoxin module
MAGHKYARANCATLSALKWYDVLRLIASIHFNRDKLYFRQVLTHKDYDTGNWKQG